MEKNQIQSPSCFLLIFIDSSSYSRGLPNKLIKNIKNHPIKKTLFTKRHPFLMGELTAFDDRVA